MDRLWAMEVLARVADLGSFTRAAEALQLSRSAVTTCLRNLERHLDIRLFEPDTRQLRLTGQGEQYLARAREVLSAVALGEQELRAQVTETRGRINVQMPVALGRWLRPQLGDFNRRYPDIRLAIRLSNDPLNVIEHAIDVAVRFGHVEDADLVARALGEMRYVLCCAPGPAAQLPPHPADLDPRQCLGFLLGDHASIDLWPLEKDGQTLNIRPAGPLAFNTGDELLMAAQAGVGVARLLVHVVEPYLADGSLVPVYADWTTPARMLYMVTPRSRVGSAKVKAFTEFLLAAFEADRRLPVAPAVGVKARGRRRS